MSKAKIEKINTADTDGVIKEKDSAQMHVRRIIGFDEFTSAVNSIVNGCFDDDTGEVSYEVVDFIERAEVIERYTDYSLPDDVDAAFSVIYETDVYEQARKNIDEGQLIRLFAAAEAKLEAKEKRANAAVEVAAQEVIAKFEELTEQMEGLFGGVTPDQVSGMFDALVDGKLDEDKIVEAVMKRDIKKDEE